MNPFKGTRVREGKSAGRWPGPSKRSPTSYKTAISEKPLVAPAKTLTGNAEGEFKAAKDGLRPMVAEIAAPDECGAVRLQLSMTQKR
jgi:hypothetical protein